MGKSYAHELLLLHAACAVVQGTLKALAEGQSVSPAEGHAAGVLLGGALAEAKLPAGYYVSWPEALAAAREHAAQRDEGAAVTPPAGADCPTVRALDAEECICAFTFACSDCATAVTLVHAAEVLGRGAAPFPDLCDGCRAERVAG